MFKPGTYIRHKETGVLVRVKENTEYSSDLFELWQPQVGEYCWFYDEDCEDSYAYLSQFQEMEDDYLYIDTSDTTYDCCEPFIGILPAYLRKD